MWNIQVVSYVCLWTIIEIVSSENVSSLCFTLTENSLKRGTQRGCLISVHNATLLRTSFLAFRSKSLFLHSSASNWTRITRGWHSERGLRGNVTRKRFCLRTSEALSMVASHRLPFYSPKVSLSGLTLRILECDIWR